MQGFASESTFHGVNFICGANRKIIERIVWFVLVITSFCGFCLYFSINYAKWHFDPDIVVRLQERRLYDSPRPAITICPRMFAKDNLASLEKIFKGENITSKGECEYLTTNAHWCLSYALINIKTLCEQWLDSLEKINVLKKVNESALNLDEFFLTNQPLRTRVFTHQGVCYSDNLQDFSAIFNEDVIHNDFKAYKNFIHPVSQWTVEKGYFEVNSTPPSHPERFFPKEGYEFHTVLSQYQEKDACTSKSMFAIVHLPNEMPTEYHKLVPIKYGSKSSIVLSVKSHRTDDALRDYPPEVRKCYFEGEKKLRFFKSYSKAHCEFECVANDTLKDCICVPFWYPRDKVTRVCGLTEMNCVNLKTEFYFLDGRPSCGCYAPCIDIKYEVSSVPTNFYSFFLPNSRGTFIEIVHLSDVMEETESFLTYKLQNFITDAGSLLGLFLGCSLLSIVEAYYYTIFGVLNFIGRNDAENETTKVKKFPEVETEIDEVKRELNFLLLKVKNLEKNNKN